MSVFTVIPAGTYPPAAYPFGPAAMPTGLTQAALALDGAAMLDPALALTLSFQFSFDGGVTWPELHELTTFGGSVTIKGLPVPVYTMGASLPQPANPNRQVKGTITVSGAALTTTGTLTVV